MHRLLTITLIATLSLTASAVKKTVSKKLHSRARGAISRRPSIQAAPSSDRYKEIQEALVAKGYLKSPATGVWDQDSQEAMRKFQADQNLDATGKLTSRSLISLGLGPKE